MLKVEGLNPGVTIIFQDENLNYKQEQLNKMQLVCELVHKLFLELI